jgi:hypothetical protein
LRKLHSGPHPAVGLLAQQLIDAAVVASKEAAALLVARLGTQLQVHIVGGSSDEVDADTLARSLITAVRRTHPHTLTVSLSADCDWSALGSSLSIDVCRSVQQAANATLVETKDAGHSV